MTTNNQLAQIISRIENIDDQISEYREDRKEIFAEAKANGFDLAAIREVVKIRKKDKLKAQQLESIVDLYIQTVGDSR